MPHQSVWRRYVSMKILELPIERDNEVSHHARRARLLGALADLPRQRQVKLGRAVTHACRHVLIGGGRGVVEFCVSSSDGAQFVEVTIHSNATMSMDATTDCWDETSSLQRVGELVDRFSLDDQTGEPLQVRIAQTMPPNVPALSEETVVDWADALKQQSAEVALAIIERRKRATVEQLKQIKAQERLQQHLESDATVDETTALLSLVASKTDNAVIIMNAASAIDWTNEAFTSMTGYGLADVAEQSIDSFLFGPDTDEQSVRELSESFRHGHGISEEFLIYRKDKQTRWTQLNVTPVRDEQGEVLRWIAIGTDISRRRQAQAALESAKDAAEASNRAKSQFLANMSHEIRTPMNAIMGMTDLALSTTLSQEVRNYLTTVKHSADSLLELLNDILDLSKIEAGKMEIQDVGFALSALLKETLNTLAVKAQEKGLDLTCDVPDDIPAYLSGDPVRLRQVLVNLVGNAIKFTERGEVVVAVEKQWQADEEVSLHFSVRDTGIGIPSDRLDHIFESFTQVDSSTTRHYGGTGLGLTITAELLHLMRGRVWVESKVGAGSTFHFSLRFTVSDSGDDFQPAEALTATTESGPARSLHILVADDHPANRELASKILQRRGHMCQQASDGNEVLTAVENDKFDIVLMDIQMPNLDGFETTATIRNREQETGTHMPIIALTAHAMQGDRDRCLDAGMDAYLSKPIQARELYTLVETIGSATPIAERTTLEPVTTESEFDFGPALQRLEGDVELLKDQMRYFIADAPKLLEQILAAIIQNDAKTLHLIAHRFKGLVATYDARGVVELALRLENKGRGNAIDDEATEVHRQLCVSTDQLVNAIERYISDSSSPSST